MCVRVRVYVRVCACALSQPSGIEAGTSAGLMEDAGKYRGQGHRGGGSHPMPCRPPRPLVPCPLDEALSLLLPVVTAFLVHLQTLTLGARTQPHGPRRGVGSHDFPREFRFPAEGGPPFSGRRYWGGVGGRSRRGGSSHGRPSRGPESVVQPWEQSGRGHPCGCPKPSHW